MTPSAARPWITGCVGWCAWYGVEPPTAGADPAARGEGGRAGGGHRCSGVFIGLGRRVTLRSWPDARRASRVLGGGAKAPSPNGGSAYGNARPQAHPHLHLLRVCVEAKMCTGDRALAAYACLCSSAGRV